MNEFENNGAVIVSWDFSHGADKGVLIVGRKTHKDAITVINAFQGEEAHDIYEKLTTVKKGE
jgi:hypothetical protein